MRPHSPACAEPVRRRGELELCDKAVLWRPASTSDRTNRRRSGPGPRSGARGQCECTSAVVCRGAPVAAATAGRQPPPLCARAPSLTRYRGVPSPPIPQMVSQEGYWRRRACRRWRNCDVRACAVVRRGVGGRHTRTPQRPHTHAHNPCKHPIRWRRTATRGSSSTLSATCRTRSSRELVVVVVSVLWQ